MLIDLDKKALINLVRGTVPDYECMQDLKEYGSFTGGMVDRWDWGWGVFDDLSEEEIYNIYLRCSK